MISLNGNCCPFDIANWVFAPFLRLQSISAIIVIIFNFIWIIRRFWHVSSSSLQRRRKCAFLWDICLFWEVFALKVIRVMITCYPTNKLMHVCIYERSAYGNTSYNVHTNSLHYLHRQSTPRNRRSFLRMRIICSISWNHEWGGAEKFESTLVLHFWWYQRQTRLIDQLWLIFEKRGTR